MSREWVSQDRFEVRKVLERIFHSRWFDIDVELPPGVTISGRVPFDVVIEGEQATFRVLARDLDEANAKVFEWLNNSQGD